MDYPNVTVVVYFKRWTSDVNIDCSFDIYRPRRRRRRRRRRRHHHHY